MAPVVRGARGAPGGVFVACALRAGSIARSLGPGERELCALIAEEICRTPHRTAVVLRRLHSPIIDIEWPCADHPVADPSDQVGPSDVPFNLPEEGASEVTLRRLRG